MTTCAVRWERVPHLKDLGVWASCRETRQPGMASRETPKRSNVVTNRRPRSLLRLLALAGLGPCPPKKAVQFDRQAYR